MVTPVSGSTPTTNNVAEAIQLNEEACQLFDKGEYEKAIERYTEAILKDPSPLYYWNRVEAYFIQEQFEAAINNFSGLNMLEFSEAPNRLARCYWPLKKYEEAINNAKTALVIDPTDYDCTFILTESERHLGNIKEAQRVCAEALRKAQK
jgi:tetratricopeptide (TPR) repeat protein